MSEIIHRIEVPAPPRTLAGEVLLTFDLPPVQEVCLCWWLNIQTAPEGTAVRVNRWDVGAVQTGITFRLDVTDYVTLHNNRLLLTVAQAGKLRGVVLEAVPCGKA